MRGHPNRYSALRTHAGYVVWDRHQQKAVEAGFATRKEAVARAATMNKEG